MVPIQHQLNRNSIPTLMRANTSLPEFYSDLAEGKYGTPTEMSLNYAYSTTLNRGYIQCISCAAHCAKNGGPKQVFKSAESRTRVY